MTATEKRKPRLGWLGPALLAVGIAGAVLGTCVVLHDRPAAGAVIDVIAINDEFAVLVRAEAEPDGTRNFVQLVHVTRGAVWTAMVPHYVGQRGRPAIGWADNAISVRVTRGGEQEIWSFSTIDATKLGQLSLTPYAMGEPHDGGSKVITATDGVRSFEVVDGTDGTRIVAFDLQRGAVIWQRDLDRLSIMQLEAYGHALKVTTFDNQTHWLDTHTGAPASEVPWQKKPESNVAEGREWTMLAPDTLAVRDTQTGEIVAKLAVH